MNDYNLVRQARKEINKIARYISDLSDRDNDKIAKIMFCEKQDGRNGSYIHCCRLYFTRNGF